MKLDYDLKHCFANRFAHVDPVSFEYFVADLFRKKGYKATVTSQSGDFGADIIAEQTGRKIAVQVKRHSEDNTVGVQAITHLNGGKEYYSCHGAICVTTSSYSQPAIEMASRLGVELWDWDRLKQEIAKIAEYNNDWGVSLDTGHTSSADDPATLSKSEAATYVRDAIRRGAIILGSPVDWLNIELVEGRIDAVKRKGRWCIPREALLSRLDEEYPRAVDTSCESTTDAQKPSMSAWAWVVIAIIVLMLLARACNG